MLQFLHKYLAPMIARLVAIGLMAVSPWVGENLGMQIDEQTQQTIQDLAAGLVIYVVGHRLISKKTNPSDVAKPAPVPEKELPPVAAVKVAPLPPKEG